MIFDQSGQRTPFSNVLVYVQEILALVRFKMANSRFHKTSAVQIQGLVKKTRNSNTDTSTKAWVNTFSAWAKERSKPENMSRPTLLNTERRSPAVLQSGSLPETSLPLQPIQLQNLSSNYQYLQGIAPLPTTRFVSCSTPYQRQFQSPSFAGGPIIQPPSFAGGPINLQTFNISTCNVTISAPAQPDTKKPRYDSFEIDPDLDFSLFTELLNKVN